MLVVAIAAVVALVVVVVQEVRRPPGPDCLQVDPALVAAIASRPRDDPIRPIAARAVRDRWVKGRASFTYEDYYVIAMGFVAPDGSTNQGIWVLGTDADEPEHDAPLAVSGPIDGMNSTVEPVNDAARRWTNWPGHDIPLTGQDRSVLDVGQCR
ncbi:hypothetical protein OG921_12755 [Aldersonia sp. NBC_00410]|uniref:hypothetical protein n=1 Tax=Aldersonia sp. NBC_00410 TaxID=2975954 RepID=UPI00225BADC6|nr:hypothetical protein [Aldersonia sp. NBC_00410]MCX5044039.1 hypothetical protein [Aldersonia sp. NBC_00410]